MLAIYVLASLQLCVNLGQACLWPVIVELELSGFEDCQGKTTESPKRENEE